MSRGILPRPIFIASFSVGVAGTRRPLPAECFALILSRLSLASVGFIPDTNSGSRYLSLYLHFSDMAAR